MSVTMRLATLERVPSCLPPENLNEPVIRVATGLRGPILWYFPESP